MEFITIKVMLRSVKHFSVGFPGDEDLLQPGYGRGGVEEVVLRPDDLAARHLDFAVDDLVQFWQLCAKCFFPV